MIMHLTIILMAENIWIFSLDPSNAISLCLENQSFPPHHQTSWSINRLLPSLSSLEVSILPRARFFYLNMPLNVKRLFAVKRIGKFFSNLHFWSLTSRGIACVFFFLVFIYTPLFYKIYLRHFVLCLVAQSCLTLWDPMDCSPPGSSVHGIL